MPSESEFARKYTKMLREEMGAMVMAITPESFGAAGWPDRLVIHPKWSGFIENKKNANPLTTLQKLTIRRIRARSFNAVVLRWWGDVIQITDEENNVLREFRDVRLLLEELHALHASK